jgi:hypothetical protein
MELGPLSNAQTAKLLFRHPRLRDADSKSVKVVQRVIGGHPRMIEYLDAILNRGRARLASVEAKLRALARKRNIDLEHAGSAMEEAIHKALEVGAADVLLDELLAIASETPGDRKLLFQASVFPMPVPEQGITQSITNEETPLDIGIVRNAVRRLRR